MVQRQSGQRASPREVDKLPADVIAFLKGEAAYKPEREWGPDPVICRWCGCWLYSTSTSRWGEVSEVHDGAHKPDCIAVRYLGASTEPRKIQCTCNPYRSHPNHTSRSCPIPNWKEPYL